MIPIVFLYLLRYVLTSGVKWTPSDIVELVMSNSSAYDPRSLDCYIIEPDNLYLNTSEIDDSQLYEEQFLSDGFDSTQE